MLLTQLYVNNIHTYAFMHDMRITLCILDRASNLKFDYESSDLNLNYAMILYSKLNSHLKLTIY